MANPAIDLTIDSPPSLQRKRPIYESNEQTIVRDDQEEQIPPCFSTEVEQRLCTKETKRGKSGFLRSPNDDNQRVIEWVDIQGDDDVSCDATVDEEWKKIVADGIAWTDPAFPPSKESVAGPKTDSGANDPTLSDPGRTPNCRCAVAAKRATVQKDTPNKGREYFHCAERRCGFFAWADNRQQIWSEFTWKRFPSFVIVSDYGFSAKDLLQGGVGDCWFLSALAVVAERHDLIAKLFADTTPTPSGCYNIRLFLDGRWRSILVPPPSTPLGPLLLPLPYPPARPRGRWTTYCPARPTRGGQRTRWTRGWRFRGRGGGSCGCVSWRRPTPRPTGPTAPSAAARSQRPSST
jgi:hypothetical protein